MPTCPHGLDAGTCLICSTLGASTTTAAKVPTAPSAVPGGRVEVVGRGRRGRSPRSGPHLGLVGWLVVLIAIALLGWWILGLIWAVLRIVELVAVGLVCGYVGYKIGFIAGRHHQQRGG